MTYELPQETIDNLVLDAEAFAKFITGLTTETVETRTGAIYDTLAKLINDIADAGGFEPFLTTAALLASTPTAAKKGAKALDTGKLWYWNGTTWTDTGLSEYDKAVANDEQLEANRLYNVNKLTTDQIRFVTAPTGVTGTSTVVTRNGIKQLKVSSAAANGAIVCYWDFPVASFPREFAGSLHIEGLTAGSNGYVGIQQLDASNAIVASSYAQTLITEAVTSKTYKMTVASLHASATKVRLIANMLTTSGGVREMYVSSPFIADGTSANFIAPLPAAVDLTPLNNNITKLLDAFDEVSVSNKNKHNPALCTDGMTVNYADGVAVAFANGIAFGKQAVTAGNTYTYWIPTGSAFQFFPVMYTYAANGAYLGIDHSVGGSGEIVNSAPPTGIVYSDANHTVTFTIPAGSSIAFIQMRMNYATHTGSDFTALVNSMQLELGSVKTAFEAYNPSVSGSILVLKNSRLPSGSGGTTTAALTSKETFVVVMDATDLYIRTKFNATSDLVQQVRYNSTTAWSNNVVNLWASKTIPAATTKDNTVTAFASGTLVANQTDDATPLNYNNTYIGANHGAFVVHQIVKSSHGKTYADVGSKWSDGTRNYTLVRIVDANTLWLVSDNTGTSSAWVFYTTALSAGSSLTHVSGATNTGAISSITSDTLTQLTKALNNHTKKVIVNGYKELTTAGTYEVESLEITDAYDIMNVPAILTYLQGRVGTTTEQLLSVDSIASDVRTGVTYEYTLNGAITVTTLVYIKQAIKWGWIGLLQALPLDFTGKSLLLYVPKINPLTVSSVTYDLKNVADVSTPTVGTLNLTKGNWIDANLPPDRMVSIVKNGANKEIGHILGHSLTRGITVPATRKAASEVGFFNFPTKKMYPHSMTGDIFAGSVVPAGTVVNAVAYRSLYDTRVVPELTALTWFKDNKDYFVVIDAHTNLSAFKVKLPNFMQGKNVSIADSDGNLTVLNDIVADGGVLINVINSYTSSMLKVS